MSKRLFFPLLLATLFVSGCAGGTPGTPDRGPSTLPAPETLIGKDAAAIKSLIGAPSLVRRDGPAEIWQYVGAGCTANLFLYQSGSDQPFTLDHIDALGINGARMDTAACFADIEAVRRAS